MSRLVLFALALVVPVLITIRLGRPVLTATFAALLLGPAFYFAIGRQLAEVKGEGQFYSVPFGGDAVSDAAVIASVAVWMAGAFVLAWIAARALRPD